ncbi:MAG: hypothetical protein KF678_04465 [Phycisphaeraceae bacterium]|nr:hypothetical protein [Phycisphaeraceae bacterium]
MLTPDIAASLAQLGAAGLIGWLWLAERRAAAARETQLRELHDRILQERPQIAALLAVVRDNTRALTALEAGQRAMVGVVERVVSSSARRNDEPAA